MPCRHPTFKNHRKLKKSSGEKLGTFFAVGVTPLGIDGSKKFFLKFFWVLRAGGHKEGVGAGSCHSRGEAQNSNDGKFPPPKDRGKTCDKRAAYEWVPSRTLGKALAGGESSAWSRSFRCIRRGAIALCRPGAKTAVCFSLGIRLFRAPAANTYCPTDPLTLGWPLCGPWRRRGGPESSTFIFPGGDLGAHLRVQPASAPPGPAPLGLA